jgi:pimeloyl-ACP methyl ester carboxylesterase
VDPVPDPDGWFHVKLDVQAKTVRAFVNNAQKPSLEVERLSGTTTGGLALWVGNNSDGSFANLAITPSQSGTALPSGEKVPYGNNPTAGRYLNAADGTRLYHEVYGQGEPLVLLHGGVYGYIDEFAPFIDKLKENYQVICLATRGHGKSGIGPAPYSYQQRAEDASTIIRTLTKDSVIVLGFSDGGYSGYKLAALYPQLVKKLIAIGAADRPKGGKREKASYTSESLLKGSESFFKSRLALMPEPERWNESLSKLNHLYNQDFVSSETFRMIPKAQLAVIPGCSHVVFHCNFAAVWEAINPFLKN